MYMSIIRTRNQELKREPLAFDWIQPPLNQLTTISGTYECFVLTGDWTVPSLH